MHRSIAEVFTTEGLFKPGAAHNVKLVAISIGPLHRERLQPAGQGSARLA
jgi:hypothetical protein